MKKIWGITIAIFCMALACSACQVQVGTQDSGVSNPIQEKNSIEDINETVGFTMVQLPEGTGFYPEQFSTIDKTIGQIEYRKRAAGMEAEPVENPDGTIPTEVPQESADGKEAEASEEPTKEAVDDYDGPEVVLRMASGSLDISGVGGVEYTHELMRDIEVNFGTYEDMLIAWFHSNGYTYAVTATEYDSANFNTLVKNLITGMMQ